MAKENGVEILPMEKHRRPIRGHDGWATACASQRSGAHSQQTDIMPNAEDFIAAHLKYQKKLFSSCTHSTDLELIASPLLAAFLSSTNYQSCSGSQHEAHHRQKN